MFTGIIEKLLPIQNINKSSDFYTLSFNDGIFKNEIEVGDSIAINGVCLTVSDISNGLFSLNVIKETLDKTNLGDLKVGSFINVERAMKISDRFDGHLVQGHVEDVGVIYSKEKNNKQVDLVVKINKSFLKYCIVKGSIALDGISLTIADIEGCNLRLAIIPHTYNNTNLQYKNIDDKLNIETDVFAKHIERLLNEK